MRWQTEDSRKPGCANTTPHIRTIAATRKKRRERHAATNTQKIAILK
ncbi:MAG: hypothetical protein ACXAHE_02375 [Roseburia sp. 1XD42-69]